LISGETEFKLKKNIKIRTPKIPNKINSKPKKTSHKKGIPNENMGKSRGIHKSAQNAADFVCCVGSSFVSIYPVAHLKPINPSNMLQKKIVSLDRICKQKTQSK